MTYLLRTLLATLLTMTLAAPVLVEGKEGPETREVRIYFLDRPVPRRPLKNAVASLTVTKSSSQSATYLLPLVERPDNTPVSGLIRELVSTPYFVEFVQNDASAPKEPGQLGVVPGGPVHETPGQPLNAADVLRRAHAGPCFMKRIPASMLSGSYQFAITLRLDNQTLSTEEIPSDVSSPGEAVEGALQAIRTLWDRAEGGTTYMELKPVSRDFMKNLVKLARTGFEDDTGKFELDRQWCLAQGRAIDKACDEWNPGLVQLLSKQCEPRLKQMQAFIAGLKKPSSSP